VGPKGRASQWGCLANSTESWGKIPFGIKVGLLNVPRLWKIVQ
jgi:hypothetical protein